MGFLTTTPLAPRHGRRARRAAAYGPRRSRGAHEDQRAFTPLVDAKAASVLLDVPYTWLLAQARAGRIPHHRLGHYVRFKPDDLGRWLAETRSGVHGSGSTSRPTRRQV